MATKPTPRKKNTATTQAKRQQPEVDYRPLLFGATLPKSSRPRILAAHWFSTKTRRVPMLWGQTSVGKTYDVRKFAEAVNAHFEVILTQSSTPDEVIGFQTYNSVTGNLEDKFPAWFRRSKHYLEDHPEGKVILFFDEMDKPKESTLASLLTFFRDGHLKGEYLPGKRGENWQIWGACNPGVFKGAMKERLAFIHYPADADALAEMADTELAKFIAGHGRGLVIVENAGDSEYDNTPPPAPEILNKANLDVFNQVDAEFWRMPQEVHEIIFSAVLPEVLAEKTMRHISESMTVDASDLARNPDLLHKMCVQLERPKAVPLAISAFAAMSGLSEQEMMECIVAVHMAFLDDPEKLRDFYNAEKPESVAQLIQTIKPENLEKFLSDGGYLSVENGNFKGKFIDLLEKHLEESTEEEGN